MRQELHIAKVVSATLNKLNAELSEQQVLKLLETPKDDSLGDLAFPCFTLARSLKKGPPVIAKELSALLSSELDAELVTSVVNTGPYLNFKYNTTSLAEELITKALHSEWTKPEPSLNERIIIEYSQPNTHKAFHVGHTRNVALGDALVRLTEWAGMDVIASNYIGDVGAHIAKCLWYYKNYYNGPAPEGNLGEFLGSMYVKGNDLLDFTTLTLAPLPGIIACEVKSIVNHPKNDKWNVVNVTDGKTEYKVVCGGSGFSVGDIVGYAPVGVKVSGREVVKADKKGVESNGVICSEKELSVSSDKDKIFVLPAGSKLGEQLANICKLPSAKLTEPTVVEEMQKRLEGVSQVLKSLENGDPETVKLWEDTKKWSMDEFYRVYDWLGARFDHYFFESDVAEPGKKIVKENFEKGIFVKSEGAIGIDLSKYKLPFFLLLKSDGTGLYSTKDLALAGMKFTKYNVDRSVYVVDDSQSLHFQQVFATLKELGFENASKCYHLAYGKVERPDGKMGSRKGNVIYFSDLKETLTGKIKAEFLSKYDNEWSTEEIKDAAHKIALATIRYGMLNQDSNKNIVFDLDEWTSRSGNTGPYMMYAYARIQSMLRDSKLDIKPEDLDYSLLTAEPEHRLLMQISRFRKVALKAALDYQPHLMCFYMYQLAKDFSSFYSQCPVLKADSEELKRARLGLCKAAAETLKTSLNLLGIPVIERM